MCISYDRWCRGNIFYPSYSKHFNACPELVRTFNSDRLCQNATFWKDKGDEDDRCKGNNPGQKIEKGLTSWWLGKWSTA
jgi:hypothetical protein